MSKLPRCEECGRKLRQVRRHPANDGRPFIWVNHAWDCRRRGLGPTDRGRGSTPPFQVSGA